MEVKAIELYVFVMILELQKASELQKTVCHFVQEYNNFGFSAILYEYYGGKGKDLPGAFLPV